MHRSAPVSLLTATLLAAGFTLPALAQEQVLVDRGLTEDVPYTIYYPNVLTTVDDGNPDTVITLRHAAAPIQCDAFVVPGGAADWTAESALQNFDASTIESAWATDFPGFAVTGQSVTSFASGPALIYEGRSDNSPMGVPVSVVHAEAVDGGRSYALECILEQSVAADARPMVDFIIANFSTRSDGECCTNPADDRG